MSLTSAEIDQVQVPLECIAGNIPGAGAEADAHCGEQPADYLPVRGLSRGSCYWLCRDKRSLETKVMTVSSC